MYLIQITLKCLLFTAMATCDPPPSPPTNGYIIPYTSTIEGTTAIYVIQNCNQIGDHFVCTEYNVTTVCNEMGKWELNSGDRVCKDVPGIYASQYNIITAAQSLMQ